MLHNLMNYMPVFPEMFMLIMACAVLLLELYLPVSLKNPVTYFLSQFALVVAFILSLSVFNSSPELLFSNSFILDPIASVLKFFIYLTTFFVFWYSYDYVINRKIPLSEYYVLGLFCVLGMMIAVSAHNFLSLYLGLELFSLPLYAMVAIRRDHRQSIEGSMKYFVMGALASGLLLYGLSLLYGATHSLDIAQVSAFIANTPESARLIMTMGLVFVVAGLAFKIGAAPFHMWVPDVYDGAPTPVTLFIGSAPKIATLGIIIRLLIDAMPNLSVQWQQMLIVAAILSMAIGNIAAIVQTNIKRMLAYSAIAHMGFMSLGLIALTKEGYAAAVFYMIAYALMSLGGFGMLVLFSRAGFDVEKISDLKGLNQRHPWLAFMMLLVMFSMAGIPPTVGFFAKFAVLQALVHVHMTWLVVVALVFAIIGSYYYIAVVKAMYFEAADPLDAADQEILRTHEAKIVAQNDITPLAGNADVLHNHVPLHPISSATTEATRFNLSLSLRIAMTLNGLSMLLLGMFPNSLIALCVSAVA